MPSYICYKPSNLFYLGLPEDIHRNTVIFYLCNLCGIL
jgi:hypothetical protein